MLNERRLQEMRSGSRLEGCFDAIVPRQASSALLERDRMVRQARRSSAAARTAAAVQRAVAHVRAAYAVPGGRVRRRLRVPAVAAAR